MLPNQTRIKGFLCCWCHFGLYSLLSLSLSHSDVARICFLSLIQASHWRVPSGLQLHQGASWKLFPEYFLQLHSLRKERLPMEILTNCGGQWPPTFLSSESTAAGWRLTENNLMWQGKIEERIKIGGGGEKHCGLGVNGVPRLPKDSLGEADQLGPVTCHWFVINPESDIGVLYS